MIFGLIPQVRVGVGAVSLRVIQFLVYFVLLEHVQHHKVHHALFPTERFGGIDQFDPFDIIVFHLFERTFVCQETLASDVRRRVQLQKDQVRMSAFENLLNGFVVGKIFVRFAIRHTDQFDLVCGAFAMI
jgi:hypothetical protein